MEPNGDGMECRKDLIVADRLGAVRTDAEEEYLAHLLCLGGTCRYRFNEREFELHAGDLSIIRKGCLRLFFYDERKDITFQFYFEGDFVASFDSLYKRTPSLFFLESMEPTEAQAIKRDDFYNLIEHNPLLRQQYEERLIDRFHTYQQLFLSRIRNAPRQRYEEIGCDRT